MSKKQAIEVLSQVPLFAGLSKRELEHIYKESEEETFSEGTTIVREGDSTGRFYVILDGTVKVQSDGRSKGKMGPGDFFGEMSLLDGRPRSATIVAASYVRARSIAPWNFLSILEENWPITKKVLAALSERVRRGESSAKL
ncbi:MAG TPA: cyclic nucleotide-binding domain-containing protein [Actinomycetota bacterium]|nr:cyclic nucleotide-binding domain-containing protein [Actinomycetota bacterium]